MDTAIRFSRLLGGFRVTLGEPWRIMILFIQDVWRTWLAFGGIIRRPIGKKQFFGAVIA
jgi:hypothetical protein